MRPGTLITFEGIEGVGKTTQIERLAARLRAAGVEPLLTREPGGTALGRHLRSLLLRSDQAPIDPICELMLYVADRAQHLAESIEPALTDGRYVLCDRFVDATVAYQGRARQLGVERVLALHQHPPLDRQPHRTVLFDMQVEPALSRARERNHSAGDAGTPSAEDRFEREELAFHRAVRDAYLELAARDPMRIRIVDAEGPPGDVEGRVLEAVGDLLPPECGS